VITRGLRAVGVDHHKTMNVTTSSTSSMLRSPHAEHEDTCTRQARHISICAPSPGPLNPWALQLPTDQNPPTLNPGHQAPQTLTPHPYLQGQPHCIPRGQCCQQQGLCRHPQGWPVAQLQRETAAVHQLYVAVH
jgi:hypothetical protein